MSTQQRIVIEGRTLCDLELLLDGSFHPLTGFLTQKDYQSVLDNVRLTSGEVWPMPIVFPVSQEIAQKTSLGEKIIIQDVTNCPIAHLEVQDIYRPDIGEECEKAYGTRDTNHPYVKEISELDAKQTTYYLGGKVSKINNNASLHHDFTNLRRSPQEVRELKEKLGWKTMVGFQTRNPMHRSHVELTLKSLSEATGVSRDDIVKNPNSVSQAGILIHPIVGVTQKCDVEYHTRVKCYSKLLQYYPKDTVELSLLPLSMRMAGPREALWHSLIRKNYGCTHFIVGRDHAGPSYKTASGEPFYGPYDAHELVSKYSDEIGIQVIASKAIVYVPSLQKYLPINEVPNGVATDSISGTEQRRRLVEQLEIPDWFSYPDIVSELRKEYPPPQKRGVCVYLVGLSGAGKTTLAQGLIQKLRSFDLSKKVTLLDGDIVRQHLSKGLGFSVEDRSTNVQRIGYVASEIVKHGGICLCANIAPFSEDRQINRELIESVGGKGSYVEVFVDAGLEACEQRDLKGLYKLARDGKIKEFTGISSPFEAPTNPELSLVNKEPAQIDENIGTIVSFLEKNGFI